MPIISIISQPLTNTLKAAYRPVVLIVRASRTDGDPRPPVVYCDIYIDGVFYKSQLKTQYLFLNNNSSDWLFDIQDACQEILKKKLAANPTTQITNVPEVMKLVYCKFRSSGINSEGFITPEGTTPVQGTGMNAPVHGTGTQSNSFWIANATLQHTNNQELAIHLSHHKKNGLWGPTTYPLTHRPNHYKVGLNDADVFPIVHLGPNKLKCLVLNYRVKGQSIFHSQKVCFNVSEPCVAVGSSGSVTLPNGQIDVPYNFSIALIGTAPFTKVDINKPSWMNTAIVGSNLVFSGTPDTVAENLNVHVKVNNCSDDFLELSDTINVVAENAYDWTISYTNNDSSVSIDVHIGNNGGSPTTPLYSGLYTADPITGTDPANLPADNLSAILHVPGKTIISATCNGVAAGSITGDSASWSGINGSPLLISFLTS